MSDNPASPKLSLPLLITRGLIVFPNMSETIEVSRLFSMAAVDQAKNVTNSLIFIVSQSKQEIEEPTEKDVFDVGTLCRIINYVSQTKSYRIRVVGSKRVKLSNIHPENGYYLADGEVLADSDGDKDAQLELVRKVVQALETSPEIGRNIPRSAINQFSKGVNPAELADSLAGYLDIPMDQKQAVLAEPDVNKRLEMILKLLSAAQEMAKIDENLQEKVRESAEKSQKEYFLREKMKAIKEELGEGEDQGESEDAIKDKLAKNPYPDNVKAKVKAELHRYEMMPESSLEASLIMTLTILPWPRNMVLNSSRCSTKKPR